jgi:diaminohydroxyphosphoribosylaminopyrimidine deaminase / 5-amino-6-(5-phosphoribosylamino)uracil reductase
MTVHETYMHRCLQLAALGAGRVAPNPMVGAVLVHNNRIIGEGWHQKYGEAHAEVNCIASVAEADQALISAATLYVSLEPCAHVGKTPPCTELIIAHKIPKVVIGCRDPFPLVNGKGIEALQAAGVEVITDILENESRSVNKRFFTFHTRKRPWIVLKWAQTADKKIAHPDRSRIFISNELVNRITHRWRSEEAAILAGTKTALHDDPSLTARLWPGNNPLRLVVDIDLKLPATLKVFNSEAKTVIFNAHRNETNGHLQYCRIVSRQSLPEAIGSALYNMNVQSVLVEGGAELLQSFIDAGWYDEVRIITHTGMVTNAGGIAAPHLPNLHLLRSETYGNNVINYLKKPDSTE